VIGVWRRNGSGEDLLVLLRRIVGILGWEFGILRGLAWVWIGWSITVKDGGLSDRILTPIYNEIKESCYGMAEETK
jgi:hypothetical protein